MAKVLFIVNPKAGTKRTRDSVLSAMDNCTHDWSMVRTEYPGHATELASETDADIVVAVGGDGTVNEVARGLVNTEKALGIIPCGSGNGLALHLGVSRNPSRAVSIVNKAKIISVDSATIDGQPFFCTCGVGLDAEVSVKFANAGSRGLKTYVEQTFNIFSNYQPCRYTLIFDGKTVKHNAVLITVANANQWGNNTKIAPHASLTDGFLEITVIKSFPKIVTGELVAALLVGAIDKSRYVKSYKAKEIKILRDSKGPGHADGDPVNPGEEINISIVPSSLKVVIP